MLFEFILEDRNLPPQMQVMLARLQIPVSQGRHPRPQTVRAPPASCAPPARWPGRAAKSWSEESDRDGRLHDKVKAIVDRLLQEFDDDMTIFDRLSGRTATIPGRQPPPCRTGRAARCRIHSRPRKTGTGASPRRARNPQSHRRPLAAAADPRRREGTGKQYKKEQSIERASCVAFYTGTLITPASLCAYILYKRFKS